MEGIVSIIVVIVFILLGSIKQINQYQMDVYQTYTYQE